MLLAPPCGGTIPHNYSCGHQTELLVLELSKIVTKVGEAGFEPATFGLLRADALQHPNCFGGCPLRAGLSYSPKSRGVSYCSRNVTFFATQTDKFFGLLGHITSPATDG